MPPLPHERRVAFRNIDAIGSIPDVDKIATESIRFNLQIDIFHSGCRRVRVGVVDNERSIGPDLTLTDRPQQLRFHGRVR